jgi:hypothetical protein
MTAGHRYIPAHPSMPPRHAAWVLGVALGGVLLLSMGSAHQANPPSPPSCVSTGPGSGSVSVSCGGSK